MARTYHPFVVFLALSLVVWGEPCRAGDVSPPEIKSGVQWPETILVRAVVTWDYEPASPESLERTRRSLRHLPGPHTPAKELKIQQVLARLSKGWREVWRVCGRSAADGRYWAELRRPGEPHGERVVRVSYDGETFWWADNWFEQPYHEGALLIRPMAEEMKRGDPLWEHPQCMSFLMALFAYRFPGVALSMAEKRGAVQVVKSSDKTCTLELSFGTGMPWVWHYRLARVRMVLKRIGGSWVLDKATLFRSKRVVFRDVVVTSTRELNGRAAPKTWRMTKYSGFTRKELAAHPTGELRGRKSDTVYVKVTEVRCIGSPRAEWFVVSPPAGYRVLDYRAPGSSYDVMTDLSVVVREYLPGALLVAGRGGGLAAGRRGAGARGSGSEADWTAALHSVLSAREVSLPLIRRAARLAERLGQVASPEGKVGMYELLGWCEEAQSRTTNAGIRAWLGCVSTKLKWQTGQRERAKQSAVRCASDAMRFLPASSALAIWKDLRGTGREIASCLSDAVLGDPGRFGPVGRLEALASEAEQGGEASVAAALWAGCVKGIAAPRDRVRVRERLALCYGAMAYRACLKCPPAYTRGSWRGIDREEMIRMRWRYFAAQREALKLLTKAARELEAAAREADEATRATLQRKARALDRILGSYRRYYH